MTSVMVELDYETVDKIIFKQLKESRDSFAEDLASIKNNVPRNIFFWGKDDEDAAEIQKHIDALDVLLEWYRIPE